MSAIDMLTGVLSGFNKSIFKETESISAIDNGINIADSLSIIIPNWEVNEENTAWQSHSHDIINI